MSIDFSEFHPLDHTLAECRGYPGGWLRHLRYRWQFQWREQLVIWLHHQVGRHVWRGWARAPRDGETGEWTWGAGCAGCDAKPPPIVAARVIGNMRNDRSFTRALNAFATLELDDDDDEPQA